MPRVICNLDNAGDEISGVKFYPLEDGGKVSDEISDEQAALFLSISGYEDYEGAAPPSAEPKVPPPTSRKQAPAKVPKAAPADTTKGDADKAPVVPAAPAGNETKPAGTDGKPEDSEEEVF